MATSSSEDKGKGEGVGGVGLYIREAFDVMEIETNDDEIECLWTWLTGEVPGDRELANETPIHKMGGKEVTIGLTSVPGPYPVMEQFISFFVIQMKATCFYDRLKLRLQELCSSSCKGKSVIQAEELHLLATLTFQSSHHDSDGATPAQATADLDLLWLELFIKSSNKPDLDQLQTIMNTTGKMENQLKREQNFAT
ncbi:hypothetical protein TURU_011580 [Turdus rufiventris]|nr:hypothetical protein TURU_011580 [Turdus rufiventris]